MYEIFPVFEQIFKKYCIPNRKLCNYVYIILLLHLCGRKYFPIACTNCPGASFSVQYFMTKEHVCAKKKREREATTNGNFPIADATSTSKLFRG